MKIKYKLLAFYSIFILIFGLTILFTSTAEFSKVTKANLSDKLDAVSKLGYKYVDSVYPGPWNIKDGT
jgi:hypothetical protein